MALTVYAYEADHTNETKTIHNGEFKLTYDPTQKEIIYAPEALTSNQFYNKTEVDQLIASEGARIYPAFGIVVTSYQGIVTIGTKIDNHTITYDDTGALIGVD
jgi:hypothetical protein